MEDFKVDYLGNYNNGQILVTSAKSEAEIQKRTNEILSAALNRYGNSAKQYQSSVFTADDSNNNELTIDKINTLANGIHSTLANVTESNTYILRMLDTNPLFGLAYSIFYAVINTNYRLIYSNPYGIEINENILQEVRDLIDAFNNDVSIEDVIRNTLSGVYTEGNYVLYLELDKNKLPQIQNFPLSFCYPSYYMSGNDRVLEFDVNKLKNKLRKTYTKTKKNKAVYFENIEKEIKANYPAEVYQAYKTGEKVVKLDSRYGKCLTINNYGRQFGVSPLFKALKSSIVIDNLIKADIVASKSRSKIIIFQKLSNKLLGDKGEKRGLAEQELAHQQAAQALQTSSCLYTAPAFVESIEYVQPNNNNKEAVDMMKQYNTQLLNALGISFYDSESATGTSVTVSYNGLLKIVNSISESLSKIISRFYQEVLEFYGYDRQLAPIFKICPAEELDLDKKIELAKMLYTTFNCSLQTSLEYVGINVEDEVARRQSENDNGTYSIMFPRATSYNTTENNQGGRPAEDNLEGTGKQTYDKDYNKNARAK